MYRDNDLVKSIDNFLKAVSLNRGEQLPELLRNIGKGCLIAGFPENTSYYWKEALNLDGRAGDLNSYEFQVPGWCGCEKRVCERKLFLYYLVRL